MASKKHNLSAWSLVLSLVPWSYYILAELLPRVIVMIAAPVSCICLLISIVIAIITLRNTNDYSSGLSKIALVLNILYIAAVIMFLVKMCGQAKCEYIKSGQFKECKLHVGQDSLAFGSKTARIVDSRGKGIAGAVVEFDTKLTIKDRSSGKKEERLWQGGKVITASNGRLPIPPIDVTVDHKKQITFLATIAADGFLTRKDIRFGVNYGDDKGAIDLFRPSTIEGVITGTDNELLANADISLSTLVHWKHPSETYSGCFDFHVSSDGQGYFKIEQVPPGVHLLYYPGRGAGCNDAKVPVKNVCGAVVLKAKDGENIDDIVLDLSESTCKITGKIVDKTGQPIEGAKANIYAELKMQGEGWSSGSTAYFHSSQLTNSDGQFLLENLPKGQWVINASYPYVKGRNTITSSNIQVYLNSGGQAYHEITLKRQIKE